MKEFRSAKAFSAHLERLALATHPVIEHLAKAGAEVIADRAKDNLGHYQDAHAPFEAWQKLTESTLKAHDRLGVGESPLLVTGGLYASIGATSSGDTGIAGSTSPIMQYQEFGTSKIPPRSVLGMAAVQSKDDIKHNIGASLAAYLAARGWKRPRIKLKEGQHD